MQELTAVSKQSFIALSAFLAVAAIAALAAGPQRGAEPESVAESFGSMPALAALVPNLYIYSFNSAGVLYEAGSVAESTSPYWWVNSGAKLIMQGGAGSTIQGDLPLTDKWRVLYAAMNPLDTDGGRHPQNTFRLVSRNTWDNALIQAQFYIAKDNLSDSPNRNASNGLLLMSRYVDAQTLYYAGIRVDGAAVIKKKYKGTYYTMAYRKIFEGTYDRDTNPNLLPHREWLYLRDETVTNADGSVTIRLYMQREGSTKWIKIAEATDDGKQYGGTPPITQKSQMGIRTDFMDVKFENFRTLGL